MVGFLMPFWLSYWTTIVILSQELHFFTLKSYLCRVHNVLHIVEQVA
jgi:hypothetical protein